MKHLFFPLVCLGVLTTVTGCYLEPAPYGVAAVDLGVSPSVEETPYRSYSLYRRDDWHDEGRYRRWRPPYDRWRPPQGHAPRPERWYRHRWPQWHALGRHRHHRPHQGRPPR